VSDVVRLSWGDVESAASALAGRWGEAAVDEVYGVPQGGSVPAVLVAHRLGVPVVGSPGPGTLVVDDLVDSGRTADRVPAGVAGFDALFRKPHSPTNVAPHAVEVGGWLAFPWEKDDGDPTDAVVRLLELVGEDPTRPGLVDTPRRVVNAWREMTAGYQVDPVGLLRSAVFTDGAVDQMVTAGPFPFSSICEHHLLPFSGVAAVSYVPRGGRVTGLSKLPRAVHALAGRLQVQERLTRQIADAMVEALDPAGVAVVVSAVHSCASLRGVRTRTPFTTSEMRGVFRDRDAARSELLHLIRVGGDQ
jgi:GTP cyclohydrolase I